LEGSAHVTGILLAAGYSRRYGANKLVQRLPDGTLVAVASARNLLAALPGAVAVVRADVPELIETLARAGMRVVICDDAHLGMGATLACGVRASAAADGWVVALADMPFIRPETIRTVAAAIAGGADRIVAPRFGGERGHPVGFPARYGPELSLLSADEGARALVKRDGTRLIDVDDPGVVRDIDTPSDLPR